MELCLYTDLRRVAHHREWQSCQMTFCGPKNETIQIMTNNKQKIWSNKQHNDRYVCGTGNGLVYLGKQAVLHFKVKAREGTLFLIILLYMNHCILLNQRQKTKQKQCRLQTMYIGQKMCILPKQDVHIPQSLLGIMHNGQRMYKIRLR